MNPLDFTICAEGPSDDMLLPVVRWALHARLGEAVAINGRVSSHGGTLDRRIEIAVRQSGGCDLLVIHLDADRADGHDQRIRQIDEAVAIVTEAGQVELPACVRVVPVREAEAWLLFNPDAVRRAAGRPDGDDDLRMPGRGFDTVVNPKRVLDDALDRASGLKGRKLDKFKRDRRPVWVARCIDDFAPLRRLAAFQAFEAEIDTFTAGWLAAQVTDDPP